MARRKKTSTAKKASSSSPKSQDWTEAAAKTEVANVAFSDEFHAPINESNQPSLSQNKRVLRFLLLLAGLLILAVVFVVLLHEGPLDS